MPAYTQWNQTVFDDLLEKHKKRRQEARNYQASDFRQFLPQELKTDWKPQPFYEDQQDTILSRSRVATQIALEKAENKAQYRAMLAAQRARDRARRNAIALQNQPNVFGNPNLGPVFTGGSIGGGGKFRDPTPLSGVGVGNVRTINWRGRSLTLNASAMNNFVGFLNALTRTGYKIHSLGSYANRNIAGTSQKSLHAYGLAIDINPSENPVTWNGVPITNLPPGVGALAAKYGLKWGGAWQGSKTDAMHFSIPWGGRM